MKLKITFYSMGRGLKSALKRFREWLTPGPMAVTGAAIGVFSVFALLGVLPAIPYIGYMGWGPAMGYILVVLLLALLGALLVNLVFGWLGRIRPLLRIALLSGITVVLMHYSINSAGNLLVYGVAALSGGLLGGGLYLITKNGQKNTGRRDNILVPLGLLLGLAGLAGGAVWLLHPGKAVPPPLNAALEVAAPPPLIDLPDPYLPGGYEVGYLTYGSGNDKQRSEYSEEVAFATPPVDGSVFLGDWSGFRGRWRSRFFGFGPDSLPLNARLWFPLGEGPFPLVLIVHGNHLAQAYSDPGYEYLGRLLASRGYLVASVDQNFLNGSYTDLLKNFGNENDARGWLLLKHLQQWEEWNQEPGHPFYRKADMDRIALIGHSRGGEAVMHAAFFNHLPVYPDNASEVFDFGFGIRSVVAIAPVDGQYQPAGIRTPLSDVNYLVIQGSHDADVSSFQGARTFHRLDFSPGFEGFKAGVYAWGANHGQFNTRWGRKDFPSPRINFFNLAQLIEQQEQQRLGGVYISAFLETTLRDEKGYLPLFIDARSGRHWLPETIYLSQFESSATRFVSRFEEDLDLSTTTLEGGRIEGSGLSLWREQLVGLAWGNQHTRAVYLGWEPDESGDLPPSYTLHVPAGAIPVNDHSLLVFSLAHTGETVARTGAGGQEDSPGLEDEPGSAGDVVEEEEADDGNDEEAGEEDDAVPIDFTIELRDAGGHTISFPLSACFPLQPRLERQLTKLAFMQNVAASETVFQFYRFPLSEHIPEGSPFDPAQLSSIRFVFDISPNGGIALNDIGFLEL